MNLENSNNNSNIPCTDSNEILIVKDIINKLTDPSKNIDEVLNCIVCYFSINMRSRKFVETEIVKYLKENTKLNTIKDLLKKNSSSFDAVVNNLLMFIVCTARDPNLLNLISKITTVTSSRTQECTKLNLNQNIEYLEEKIKMLESKLRLRQIELNETENTILENLGHTKNNLKCPICVTNLKTHVIIPCGHKCLCSECSLKFNSRDFNKCPICSTKIDGIYKVYNA